MLSLRTDTKQNPLLSAFIAVLVSIAGWTLYVALMAAVPNPFASDLPRALARVLIVLLPAIFHIIRQQGVSKLDYLQLRQKWFRGVIVGLAISGGYLAFIIATTMKSPNIEIPVGFAIWLNFIIGSPLAEELLFRGVLFNELSRVVPAYQAIAISALMFAILHLPVWFMLDGLPITLIIGNFIQIFTYGVVFAILMKVTKSLWAPLSAHWLNNLILRSVVESALN